jgi:long-chain fatty acid transport protein
MTALLRTGDAMRKTILIALLCTPVLGLASGYEVINVNPRDLALSHSAGAAQRDAAATFTNPAALSKLDGLNLSLAGSLLNIDTTWTAPGNDPVLSGSESTDFALTTPVALFVAYGAQVMGRSMGVGFGMATPGGGEMNWPDDWQGRGRIITAQRRFLGFYLNGGYQVFPWLRVGGGGIYYYGAQYFEIGIQPFAGQSAELQTSGGGFSYQLSAEVAPVEDLTFGIDYKHKATISMDGDVHFNIPAELRTPESTDQGVEQDLAFPNLLMLSAAYRISKPWLVTLQYNYSRFRVYETDTFVFDTAGDPIVIPRDYRDGHLVRGGVEWSTTERLTLRAGAMRDFSGLRKNTLSPTLPDSNTTGVSIGAGYAFTPKLAASAAFFYGNRDRQTAEGPDAFPGSYKTHVYILAAGVVWGSGASAR